MWSVAFELAPVDVLIGWREAVRAVQDAPLVLGRGDVSAWLVVPSTITYRVSSVKRASHSHFVSPIEKKSACKIEAYIH